jgi:hypothetical protein
LKVSLALTNNKRDIYDSDVVQAAAKMAAWSRSL